MTAKNASAHGGRTCRKDGCGERSVGRRLCRKHYQQAWKSGALENEPREPRTPARTICPPEHKHATASTCYIQHQCRCEPCRDGNADRARERNRLKAYGRFDTGLVDAEPVREHLLLLAEFGIGYKRVAALAGIGITPTRNIIWGRQDPGPRHGEIPKRVKRETAEALLGVKPTLENLADGARITARGTHRRIQALVARGWSLSRIAQRLEMLPSNFSTLMSRNLVSVRIHKAVAALYDELWDQLPPREQWHDAAAYTRSVRYAEQRRWLPPLAWDDIDTDPEPPAAEDEGDEIDTVAVDLAVHGERVRLTLAERSAAVERLAHEGASDAEIGVRLGLSARHVLRLRQEAGIPSRVNEGRSAS